MRVVRDLHLIWADKLALVLVAVILAAVTLFWAMIVVAAGIGGANHVLASTGLSWLEDGLIGIALLWFTLRAIDFARHGPIRALFSMQDKPGDTQHPLPISNDLVHHA